MHNYANCINTDNTLLLRYSPLGLYEKADPALECKNSKRHAYIQTQVSVVADMTFRGVARLNQVGAQFWCGEQEKRGPKGPTAGGSWRVGSQSLSPPTRESGGAL